MAILLTILKVIGIILLVVLGLVLLIILLVLFSPISYRITANHNENDTRAKAKVGFLFVNGFGSFIKGEGLDYGVNSQSATLDVIMDVTLNDKTPASNKIIPFYWKSSIENSLKDNDPAKAQEVVNRFLPYISEDMRKRALFGTKRKKYISRSGVIQILTHLHKYFKYYGFSVGLKAITRDFFIISS